MHLEELVSFFKDLSDGTRLRIFLFLLSHGETCVCKIATELGLSQPLTSYHLYHLRMRRLVTERREGVRIYYSFNRERLEQFRTCFNAEFQLTPKERKLTARRS